MKHDPAREKQSILEWMLKNCSPSTRARKRKDILPFVLPFHNFDSEDQKDRYFRKLVAELHEEGRVFSSTSKGYWAVPLSLCNLPRQEAEKEFDVMKLSADEYRAKMVSMAKIAKAIDKVLDRLAERIKREQLELKFEEVSKCD